MGTSKRKRRRPEAYRNGDWILGRRGADWIADLRRKGADGKRKRVTLGKFETERDARAAFDEFANRWRSAQARERDYKIGELWERWLVERAKDGLSNTIYRANWVSLGRHFAGLAARTLTKDDCRDYARARFKVGRSQWTVNTELSRLRGCLKWAEDERLIERAPAVWIPQPGESRKRVLTIDEAKALLEAARQGDPHIYLFVVLALTTGARHVAILDLTWDRVDWQRMLITYEETQLVDPMSKSWQKGRATVPIGRLAYAGLLQAFEARQTNHVIEYRGRRLKTVGDGFRAAVKRAGIDESQGRVTPHTLRHSVASWTRDAGIELQRIAVLLGHQDSKTTELIYSHPDPTKFIAAAVEVIDAEFSPVPAKAARPKLPKPPKRFRRVRKARPVSKLDNPELQK